MLCVVKTFVEQSKGNWLQVFVDMFETMSNQDQLISTLLQTNWMLRTNASTSQGIESIPLNFTPCPGKQAKPLPPRQLTCKLTFLDVQSLNGIQNAIENTIQLTNKPINLKDVAQILFAKAIHHVQSAKTNQINFDRLKEEEIDLIKGN